MKKAQRHYEMDKKGVVLITTMIFIAVSLIAGTAFVNISANDANVCKTQANSTKAFFLAESGIEKAMHDIKDSNPQNTIFKLSDVSGANIDLDNTPISITVTDLGSSQYQVSSTVTVGQSARTVNATVLKNPPSPVFDYAYFVNNWGWFYGSGITANGDVRSNGRFDFRQGPRVQGDIYAGQGIGVDAYGIKGDGGQLDHQHPNFPKLPMPNLQDLTYYENIATATGGTISIDGATVINGVYGDDAGETGNIVLVGTPSKPIVLNGPVVVRNDVIISGTVDGQGTIYAGRNVYIAKDLRYKNAPSSPRPASDNPTVVDNWVAASIDKDLIGLAARENIVIGDYTKTGHFGYSGSDKWYADGYIFSMGSEDVGMDGIPDTGDTGENDGAFQPAYEDLDDNGAFRGNYTWSDIQTSVPIAQFANLPSGTTKFSDIASNSINTVEGVLYTNHAIPGRLGNGAKFNGAIVSKDEALIYSNTIVFNYDERLKSKYRTNPNWLIDVKLPVATKTKVIRWWE